MIINLLRAKFVSLLLLVFRNLAQSVGILLYQYMAKLTYYLKPCKLFAIYFETKPNCRLFVQTIEDMGAFAENVLRDKAAIMAYMERSNKVGSEVVIYRKEYPDGTIYYLEEVRMGRKSLAFQSMYKKKEVIVPTGPLAVCKAIRRRL